MLDDASFDHVFADFEDGRENIRRFLGILGLLLPDLDLIFEGDDGTKTTEAPYLPELDNTDLAVLRASIADGSVGFTHCRGRLYATAVVPPLAGYLLLLFPEQYSISDPLAVMGQMVTNCIELARNRFEQHDLAIVNEQLQRQIEVMKRQHLQLIEDNHRQFRIIQQKEKEYARELESEIAGRTAELRETNQRLETASRMKSDFLANMSHELRTPMNAIIGFSGILEETPLNGEQLDYARTIRTSADSLLALINDILDLAKIEAGKLSLEINPYDLKELVESVTAMFRIPAKEKGVDVSWYIDSQLTDQYCGDSNRLRQILVNLLGNAMKFTESGGIEVRVEALRDTGGDEIQVRFSVRDTGIGIPAERQKAIFEKFEQADTSTTRKYGGTGLGLSICAQLVELMGGTIDLTSTSGKGSCFFFVIPLISIREDEKESCGSSTIKQAAGSSVHLKVSEGGRRVLLVEDNPVNQKLAMLLLQRQGCLVQVANDGVEALERLKDDFYDLVFMDIQMPNLDGLGATRRIRELERTEEGAGYRALADRDHPIPIVGLSAHARQEDQDQCLKVGMDAYLTKPIIKDQLIKVIQRFLADP
ncbi:MAG: response regulator [Proteobacteria bacterium]|nr:response regulator [Pseudomonadota bacterium]MBU1688237.1 response regulator [Pseudomonadota bacterium]